MNLRVQVPHLFLNKCKIYMHIMPLLIFYVVL